MALEPKAAIERFVLQTPDSNLYARCNQAAEHTSNSQFVGIIHVHNTVGDVGEFDVRARPAASYIAAWIMAVIKPIYHRSK